MSKQIAVQSNTVIYVINADKELWKIDLSSGLSHIGFPVRHDIENGLLSLSILNDGTLLVGDDLIYNQHTGMWNKVNKGGVAQYEVRTV